MDQHSGDRFDGRDGTWTEDHIGGRIPVERRLNGALVLPLVPAYQDWR
jgi:hypothetical protein